MRFQSIVLAAVAALGSTVIAQSSAISSAESAASSAVSSATSSVASSVRSSGSSSSSDASSTSSTSSASMTSSSASMTSSASVAASSTSSDDEEEPTTTRVYTSTYYYITDNNFHKAMSPTLLIESVVKSTSGAVNQQAFTTPTGITMLTVSKKTYTTTYTSENHIHDVMSQYHTTTQVITTTMGLPDFSSSSEGAAGKVSAKEIGGIAAFVLGVAGMYL